MSSPTTDKCAALDLAVSAAVLSWQEALLVEDMCGMMYPFGVQGDLLCPVCLNRVYMHLGFPRNAK